MKDIYHQEDIVFCIISKQSGIVFLEGPSCCGKTKVIKEIKKRLKDTCVITGEQFYTYVLEDAKNATQHSSFLQDFKNCSCICIDDIDFYGGRPYTEREFARLFSCIGETSVVVITGIKLKEKLSVMFQSLNGYEHYLCDDGHWVQQ